ncbi:hypothetical protein tpqmel_0015 [Candidatus Gastranaerophilus sp. (ex Termes propinquus)]|nr:hypothetical protein tpqmel_0015 [Candidatus Gastranaerophilus sp. (ex Termes propinquus)]
MFKRCFLTLVALSVFATVPASANGAVFDMGEQMIEISPIDGSDYYTGSANAQAQVQNTGGIQRTSFKQAIDSLEAAEVEIREEYAVYTQKYNEAKGRYDVAKAECKALKNNIKQINNRLKNVEKTKKMIFNNMPG